MLYRMCCTNAGTSPPSWNISKATGTEDHLQLDQRWLKSTHRLQLEEKQEDIYRTTKTVRSKVSLITYKTSESPTSWRRTEGHSWGWRIESLKELDDKDGRNKYEVNGKVESLTKEGWVKRLHRWRNVGWSIHFLLTHRSLHHYITSKTPSYFTLKTL